MKKIISLLLHRLKNIFRYKMFKAHPKRTMQDSPYKGQIIPRDTSFAGQDLSHQDFTGTDFSNTDMKDAILTGCIFDKANLSQVQNLKEKQFAGCSLIDAILPADFKFSYLDNFDKMMTQARDIFALSLSTSLFGIIAVMSTADEDFLVGGKSLTMPLIGVAVDMTSLYIFLPITIMAVGLYLNIYLNKIQAIIKKFPYYLPDGRDIELLLYPWLWNYITKPLYHKKRKLRFHYAIFALLGECISYAMVHVTAGLSIMIITFTYFKVQDPIMTTFHLGILGIVTFFAFLHFRIKYRERRFVLSFLMPIMAFAFTIMMAVCGSFVYTEKPIFVNLKSEKKYTENISYENIYYNLKKIYDALFNKYVTGDDIRMSADEIFDDILNSASENINDNVPVDIAYNIKEIYAIFFHPDITVINKNISYNPSGCMSPKGVVDDLPDDKACNTVVGVDLRNRNLINLNAANSFFAKALLYNANLQNANLIGTDLRWAHLWKANLQNANLEGANLGEAYLDSANLQFANLRSANLKDANLAWAKLQKADLRWANLQDANLRWVNLQNAYLDGANLQGANLQYAKLWWINLRSVNLQNANLKYANLQNANLMEANLQGADLGGSKSQKVNLVFSNLQKADLSYATLQDANLGWSNLQKADLSRANLQNANLWGANLQRASLEGANLQNAYLGGANLQGADLSYIQFNENTNFTGAFYNSRNYANDSKIKATVFPSGFNPSEKGMIDVCTSEGKEAFKQAIQNKRYEYIKSKGIGGF